MSDTMGKQLRQKRLELCDQIELLIVGFEADTGMTVDSVAVKFEEEKQDTGSLTPVLTVRTVNVVCSF